MVHKHLSTHRVRYDPKIYRSARYQQGKVWESLCADHILLQV